MFHSRSTLFFLIFSVVLFAQKSDEKNLLYDKIELSIKNQSVDSIIKYNRRLSSLTNRDKKSFLYGYSLFNQVVYDSKPHDNIENKVKTALSIFREKKKTRYSVLAYLRLSKIFREKSNYELSNKYCDSVISLLKKPKGRKLKDDERLDFLLSAYHSISGNFYFIGEYEKALENGLIAKKYSDSLKNYTNPKVDIGLGMINIALGRHKKARQTFRELISETDKKPIQKFGYMSLASSFYEEKKHDSAIFYYKKAKKVTEEMNDLIGLATILTNIGINQTAKENYDLAEKNLTEALDISKKTNIGNIKETTLIGLGEVYIKQNKPNNAIPILKSAQQSALESNRGPILRDSYELLSEAYLKKEDYKQALQYKERYTILKDSLKSADIIKNTEELELKYETEKKEKENLELKKQTIEKDLSISQKNNIILISSLIFGLILITLVTYQLKKFRNKNRALKASIEQREKVEKELETVRDNISKDFHDDLGNRLARITSLSDLILTTSNKRDKQDLLSAVEKIKEDSDVLYSGTRDFMFSLKAKSDYTEELFTYLSDFGEEFFQSFDINFFVSKKMDRNTKLPYYWNRQIIMIFKEAMTNIAKHSEAKNVELHITLDENDLYISLKDDGKGFDIEALKRKNGLKNMSTRALKINATLHFVSNEKGTSINFDAYLPE